VNGNGKAARMGLAAALVAGSLALAGPAQAKVYSAEGAGTGDSAIGVTLELDAKAKKGKLKSASGVSAFRVTNVPFECSATGVTGRSDYGFFNDPVEVAKNGKFEEVFELEAGGYVVERYTVSGAVKGKGKSAIVSGTFMAERGAGGLQFNNCSTGQVPFKATTKL
jgi:hypothetical protein